MVLFVFLGDETGSCDTCACSCREGGAREGLGEGEGLGEWPPSGWAAHSSPVALGGGEWGPSARVPSK